MEGKRDKKRFRSDGSSIWAKRAIGGPGVWATCVKGKEKAAVGELYDLLESLAEKHWPQEAAQAAKDGEADEDAGDNEETEDLEKAIQKEVQSMKRPRKEHRFTNVPISTPCLIYVACKPPIEPAIMISKYMQEVESSGISRMRHVQRLTPVTASCDVNAPEISSLCKRHVVPHFTSDNDEKFRYRIELRLRNHSTMSKEDIIKIIASSVPEGHKVDLKNADLFILVEVFKNVLGLSVVRDYYRLKRYNVTELTKAADTEHQADE